MSDGWRFAPFDTVVRSRGSGVSGLPAKEWQESGAYPVIGQGAQDVEGWTDRSDLLLAPPSPVVLYGGHTRRVKHVKDPFVPGPNVKILEPLKGLDSRFLFHYLTYLPVESKGYADHFPLVRKSSVPIPSEHEQRRIVAILDESFKGIATAKANAEKKLQSAAFLFDCHLQNIDGPKVSLGQLVNIKTGKLDANAAIEGGAYPFFTCAREVYSIDKYAFDCEALLLAGNNAVGDFNVKHYKGKFNAYQRTYVITVKDEKEALCRFLYFELLKGLAKFKLQSVGAGTKFLKIGMINDLQVAFPEMPEQRRIASLADQVRQELATLSDLYEKKLADLEELKKSLLYQAFTGQL